MHIDRCFTHLQADLYKTIEWAAHSNKNWVFTTSNAGSRNFKDSFKIERPKEIDWDAVKTLDRKPQRLEIERMPPKKLFDINSK